MKFFRKSTHIAVCLCVGFLFLLGCEKPKSSSTSEQVSTSQADQLLNEYEAAVNNYIPKFKAVKDSMEFVVLTQQLTGEVQMFISRFNQISSTIAPEDFGRLQARLNKINAQYAALCQR